MAGLAERTAAAMRTPERKWCGRGVDGVGGEEKVERMMLSKHGRSSAMALLSKKSVDSNEAQLAVCKSMQSPDSSTAHRIALEIAHCVMPKCKKKEKRKEKGGESFFLFPFSRVMPVTATAMHGLSSISRPCFQESLIPGPAKAVPPDFHLSVDSSARSKLK